MGKSKIEWTDRTWSPVTGCTKVSPGCANCYAERMSKRLAGRFGYPADDPFKVTLHPERLAEPMRWRKPRRVFVCSMGDLFNDAVSFRFIDRVINAAFRAPQHTYLILTKRPDRMQHYFESCRERGIPAIIWMRHGLKLWLGVTCENQEQADKRIPILLQIPAVTRFVSVEPMLSAVYFTRAAIIECPVCKDGKHWTNNPVPSSCFKCGHVRTVESKIDWCICGMESGPDRRSAQIDWIKSLKNQCVKAGIPFFLKQMEIGGKLVKMPEVDGRIWDEMPGRTT